MNQISSSVSTQKHLLTPLMEGIYLFSHIFLKPLFSTNRIMSGMAHYLFSVENVKEVN